MTSEATTKSKDDAALAIICAAATAIVATAGGQDGKQAYPELMRLLSQIRQ